MRSTGRLVRMTVAVATVALSLPASGLADGRDGGKVRSRVADGGSYPLTHTGLPPTIHSPRYRDPENVRDGQERADAQAARSPARASAPLAGPYSVVIGGLNKTGLKAPDNVSRNQGTPPDTTGAIGPTHYVEVVNSKIAAYNRSTLARVSSANLDTFVGRTGDDVFDPQMQWDQQGQRWFYLADDIDSLGADYLAFGYSKTTDPSDLVNGWCRYRVNTDMGLAAGTYFDDYPKLGHSDAQVIFGTNVFRGNLFVTAHIWRYAKPAAGSITTCPAAPSLSFSGTPASPLKTADGTTAFTPVPANTADSSPNGYVVASDDAPASQIMVWHVDAAGSLVADGNVNVTSYAVPGTVPQPGTSFRLDALDGRLSNAVAHQDPAVPGTEAIWTQHTINGTGGRSAVRWYELRPGVASPRQQGTITDTANYLFNSAISPASDGSSAAVFFNAGSSTLRARIDSMSRRGSTALNQMTGRVTIGSSSFIDQDFSCSPCRWGDYSGASPDPNATDVIWGSNQFNGSTSTDPAWATRNFAVQANAAPTVSSLTPSANPVPAGSTVTWTAQATDSDGTITHYQWDLDGDGTFETDTGTTKTAGHTYPTAGSFTVRVRVVDNQGAVSAVKSVVLTVQ